MISFLSLLQFVVNTGLLINARINIQNAADLAAYAGASTQARNLNQISYLNYEMRRQYKKFLFRYYVLGNMAQKTHTTDPPGGPRSWSPDPAAPGYNVPAVCVIFNPNDNYCQVVRTRPIETIPSNPLDSIGAVLNQQLKALEAIRQQNCNSIGLTNFNILTFWLYNTDPDLSQIEQEIRQGGSGGNGNAPNQEIANILSTVRGISSGLGLIPKNLLLYQRMKTLEYYVNFPRQTQVDLDVLQNLRSTGDPGRRERTLQAYISAQQTLGQYLFDDSSIVLDELTPDTLLRLEPLRTSFEAYYIQLKTGDNNSENPNDCKGIASPVFVKDAPVGAYKDPTIMTYYALRLKAKVRIPFWPFSTNDGVILKAYSAAMPFGSRIGPSPARIGGGNLPFVRQGVKAAGLTLCPECQGVPNLPVTEGDSVGQGWNQVDVIQAMYNAFRDAGGSVVDKLSAQDMERAYHTAMAPNPSERGLYNIPNDLDAPPDDPTHSNAGDPFVNFFDNEHGYAFWAPVVSPEQLTGSQDLNDILARNLPNGLDPIAREAILNGIRAYQGKLDRGEGENSEGFSVARIMDPMRRPASGTDTGEPRLSDRFMMRRVSDIKTSWNRVKNSLFWGRGRNGYSVKFVSFQLLTSKAGITTDGQNTWSNDLLLDSEAEGDLPFVKH